MNVNELEARLSEIAQIAENPEGKTNDELEALIAEKRELTAKLDEIKAEAKIEAEKREMVAMNTTIPTTHKFEEVTTMNTNSVEYRNAWLKMMAGRELLAEERGALTSATASAGYTIPDMVADKIYENLVQVAPVLDEIELLHVPGNLTLCVENTVNNAAIHTEGAEITPASDTITRIQLGGYELVKVIGISAKLDAMSVDALENWIVSNLSRKLAELIENYVINGTGSSQPAGIDSIQWDTTNHTDCVDWASTAPTAAELITLIGKLNAAYTANAKFLMNWKTFWTECFALRDDKNDPVVKHENGQYFIFGFPVVFSAKAVDDDIYFGDLRETVKANFAKDIEIESDRSSGFLTNTVNFRGACVFDSAVIAGRIVKGSANP